MSEDEEHSMCEECGQRPATVHLTDIVDGKPRQSDLCEECYNSKKGVPKLAVASNLVAQLIGAIAPELRKVTAEHCPVCGISYLEFRQSFRLGCPKDYEVFKEPLDELLRRMHGATRHVGKVPLGAAQRSVREPVLDVLRRELKAAVEQEDYERAAQLRDEIHGLEQDRAGGDEP